MKLSVIITTYNSEEWLSKVLQGYSCQTENDFEVVIADDGSNDKARLVIESFQNEFKYPIVHVWQEDKGFQKSKILNKAILKTNTDYFLFTDGDCIPRKDFVAQHLKHKEEGYFLSGGYFKLPMKTSCKISIDNIKTQDCFSISWLIKNGIQKSFKLTKLNHNKFFAVFMNWLTPTKRAFVPKYTTIESLNYQQTYDIFSTPKVFVLDKDKKIIAKSLTISQLEDMIDRIQGIKDAEKLFPPEEEVEDEQMH